MSDQHGVRDAACPLSARGGGVRGRDRVFDEHAGERDSSGRGDLGRGRGRVKGRRNSKHFAFWEVSRLVCEGNWDGLVQSVPRIFYKYTHLCSEDVNRVSPEAI